MIEKEIILTKKVDVETERFKSIKKLMVSAYNDNGLDIIEPLIYSYIIDRIALQIRYNPTLSSRISYQKFNDTFRLRKWTIFRIRNSLKKKGYIKIIKEKGKTNRFLINKKKYDMIINT